MDEMYKHLRMPVVFGGSDMPVITKWSDTLSIGITFDTDPDMIQKILPKGLKAAGPSVYVYQNTYKNVNFMAGRGYNYFGIGVDAIYEKEDMPGMFLPVCWMNDTFAIIGGREGLGFPKLYAEMTDPIKTETGYRCFCTEYAHKMIEIEVGGLVKGTEEHLAGFNEYMAQSNWFVHKFIVDPFDPQREKAETEYLSTANAKAHVDEVYFGVGNATFFDTSWKDAPASYHIISYLKKLPVLSWKGATVWRGGIEVDQFRKLV